MATTVTDETARRVRHLLHGSALYSELAESDAAFITAALPQAVRDAGPIMAVCVELDDPNETGFGERCFVVCYTDGVSVIVTPTLLCRERV